ncbi:MAG: HPr(Ser) kinase/phosphatase [Oscillospiraceae bacterium]|nr:HPr(Ser) kinase/phosphatase [Oscillospiraceae bacterium]
MSRSHSVDLDTIARETGLTPIYLTPEYKKVRITSSQVNRAGLQLAGFYDYFDPRRIQILGKVEMSFLDTVPDTLQMSRVDKFMSSGIEVLIFAHRRCDTVPNIFLKAAERYGVNVYVADMSTSEFMAQLIVTLYNALAPQTMLHGVLMEICGEGVLICGESGVGKSETAMALMRQGHRLVADDAVEIRRINRDTLIGSAPEMIRYFMEVRGIGVVDARHLFGVGSVKLEQSIDLVVQFELWDEKKTYDRLGIDQQEMDILGVKVPLNVVPVRPGRNLAAILELAAMNNREKKMGYNAAEVLVERYNNMIDEG